MRVQYVCACTYEVYNRVLCHEVYLREGTVIAGVQHLCSIQCYFQQQRQKEKCVCGGGGGGVFWVCICVTSYSNVSAIVVYECCQPVKV